jgi:hypothetical protein
MHVLHPILNPDDALGQCCGKWLVHDQFGWRFVLDGEVRRGISRFPRALRDGARAARSNSNRDRGKRLPKSRHAILSLGLPKLSSWCVKLETVAPALRFYGSFFQKPTTLNVAARTRENLSDDDFVDTIRLVTAMAVINLKTGAWPASHRRRDDRIGSEFR